MSDIYSFEILLSIACQSRGVMCNAVRKKHVCVPSHPSYIVISHHIHSRVVSGLGYNAIKLPYEEVNKRPYSKKGKPSDRLLTLLWSKCGGVLEMKGDPFTMETYTRIMINDKLYNDKFTPVYGRENKNCCRRFVTQVCLSEKKKGNLWDQASVRD